MTYGNATHTIGGICLGASVDADGGLLNSAAAGLDDSDNTDDENGVTIPSDWIAGTTVTVPVSIENASGYLSAWFDWNADGDFDEGEHLLLGEIHEPGFPADLFHHLCCHLHGGAEG